MIYNLTLGESNNIELSLYLGLYSQTLNYLNPSEGNQIIQKEVHMSPGNSCSSCPATVMLTRCAAAHCYALCMTIILTTPVTFMAPMFITSILMQKTLMIEYSASKVFGR